MDFNVQRELVKANTSGPDIPLYLKDGHESTGMVIQGSTMDRREQSSRRLEDFPARDRYLSSDRPDELPDQIYSFYNGTLSRSNKVKKELVDSLVLLQREVRVATGV